MKKNRGFLMGIAALALLFSMAFPGCESATNGAQGDPAYRQELDQNFKISSDFNVVVPGDFNGPLAAHTYDFTATYEGINITPKQEIRWAVTGDDETPGLTGKKQIGTDMASNRLTIDANEASTYLTVTATYGGYTSQKVLTIGVPQIPITALELIKGTDIGTTIIHERSPSSYTTTITDEDTYLVYTIDPKEVTEISREQGVENTSTTKYLASGGSPSVDYNIPIGQEKWLTIYEVPLSGGESKDKHITVKRFLSLPATTPGQDSTSFVNLPEDFTVGSGEIQAARPTFALTTVQGPTKVNVTGGTWVGNTSTEHGKYSTGYTAYAVYNDPELDYGPGLTKPGLNTQFIPTSRSVVIEKTGEINLPLTGVWDIILQYTGAATKTGTGAWKYAGTVTVEDSDEFTTTVKRSDLTANTIHISLRGKTFVHEALLQSDITGLFGLSDVVHLSRDSDTGVTLYLGNTGRIASTDPELRIQQRVFNRGTPPADKADVTFIETSASDLKYAAVTIQSSAALPFTVLAGAATPAITVGNYSTFPYGDLTTYVGGELIQGAAVQYNLTWYYVDGSTWTPTGDTGPSYITRPEEAGRTLGIRVDTDLNKPDVTLVDVTQSSVTLGGPGFPAGFTPGTFTLTKWNIIGYGQRILGRVN